MFGYVLNVLNTGSGAIKMKQLILHERPLVTAIRRTLNPAPLQAHIEEREYWVFLARYIEAAQWYDDLETKNGKS